MLPDDLIRLCSISVITCLSVYDTPRACVSSHIYDVSIAKSAGTESQLEQPSTLTNYTPDHDDMHMVVDNADTNSCQPGVTQMPLLVQTFSCTLVVPDIKAKKGWKRQGKAKDS